MGQLSAQQKNWKRQKQNVISIGLLELSFVVVVVGASGNVVCAARF